MKYMSSYRLKGIFEYGIIRFGSIVWVGSLVTNILNYLFTLVMGRMLTPIQFGTVAAIFSLMVIIAVPATALSTVSAKYIGEFYGKKNLSEGHRFFRILSYYSNLFGGIILLGFLIILLPLSLFLNISLLPLFIFSLVLPLSFLSALYSGALQGLHKFNSFAQMQIIAPFLKLSLGIIFVYWGLSVSGVMLALVIGTLFSLLFGYVRIESQFSLYKKNNPLPYRKPYFSWYLIPTFIKVIILATFLLAMLSNIDLVLAKHYLEADVAGYYSALSVVSKIILYGSPAFAAVMLPMISATTSENITERRKLLQISFIPIIVISGMVLLAFIFIPNLVLTLLVGNTYMAISPLLPWFGLAMFFGACITLLVNYFIATQNQLFIWPLILSVAIELIYLFTFHSSVYEFRNGVVLAHSILLIGLISVYYYEHRKKL